MEQKDMEYPSYGKDMKRAIRRAHIDRLKKARAGYWGYDRIKAFENRITGTPVIYERGQGAMDDRRLGIVVSTPKSCSCWMCGNPRRFYTDRKSGLTLKEVAHREVERKIDYVDLGSDDESLGTKEEAKQWAGS